MRRTVLSFFVLTYVFVAFSQELMNIYKKGAILDSYSIGSVNEMDFNRTGTMFNIYQNQSATVVRLQEVDSITFTDEVPAPLRTKYSNPVSVLSLPDPTVIRAADGYFYLYATEDTYNMPIMRSRNLVDWRFVRTVFSAATRPDFEPGGGLWAPDINYVDGKYIIYYSMSVWGGQMTCGIGVAVADRPEGPFTDAKMLFRSTGQGGIGVQNSIDPCYVEDEGHKYLFWGSFNGIYGIELSDDGLSVKPGAGKRKVAGNWFEATYIHKKDGYYYLFASIGSCCNGANSTYETVVGRSKSLFGPYVNKNGETMLNNKFEYFIRSNSNFVGNGHNSRIVTDDAGIEWVLYHGYDRKDPHGRKLFLDEVKWTSDGWPFISGNSPSSEADGPMIRDKGE